MRVCRSWLCRCRRLGCGQRSCSRHVKSRRKSRRRWSDVQRRGSRDGRCLHRGVEYSRSSSHSSRTRGGRGLTWVDEPTEDSALRHLETLGHRRNAGESGRKSSDVLLHVTQQFFQLVQHCIITHSLATVISAIYLIALISSESLIYRVRLNEMF